MARYKAITSHRSCPQTHPPFVHSSLPLSMVLNTVMSRALSGSAMQKTTRVGALRLNSFVNKGMHTSQPDQPIKAVVFGLWEVVVSPWWFSMKDWEKAQNLPNKAMRTLAQNDNSVFHKVFAGDVMPDAAAKELLVEMKGQGMEVGNLKAEELGVQLTNLLKTARVNGDVRDAMQCLRFDGYQTALLTRNWKTIDIGSNLGKVGRENPLKSEISRHFNVIVETEELGVSHTDVKVLERLCDGLKMEPQDIALVDRSEDILKAARDFGLVTVQADGPGTAVRNLETLLDVPLANFAWTRDQYAKVLWGGNYAPVMKQGAGVGV